METSVSSIARIAFTFPKSSDHRTEERYQIDWRGDTLRIHRGQKDRWVDGHKGRTKKREGAKTLPFEGRFNDKAPGAV
jgi:hypothetical protein